MLHIPTHNKCNVYGKYTCNQVLLKLTHIINQCVTGNAMLLFLLFFAIKAQGQPIPKKLALALYTMQQDAQLSHALVGMYVLNASTGTVVLEHNAHVGMATASCLKVVTGATAIDAFGLGYTFATTMAYTGTITNNVLTGNLIITGSGDPTLGSWRWASTTMDSVLHYIVKCISNKGISSIQGNIILQDNEQLTVTPPTWIWEDLGNYYGAPARLLNWHENQYDMVLSTPTQVGKATTILSTTPALSNVTWRNYVTTAAAGSGDNSIIYLAPNTTTGYITGTLPTGSSNYTISGALPYPAYTFAEALLQELSKSGIKIKTDKVLINSTKNDTQSGNAKPIDAIQSPTLEAINYWYMKRSINLYGEALLQLLGTTYYPNAAHTSSKSGITYIQQYWEKKGIPKAALNIQDGSGLSPITRVTPKALAQVLLYASKQPWYSSYLKAFPTYNGMALKSGTINYVKGFAGYHTAVNGVPYIVVFLVNNYNGSSSTLISKMYKVLDVLK